MGAGGEAIDDDDECGNDSQRKEMIESKATKRGHDEPKEPNHP